MAQHLNFLRRMDELTDARETHAGNYQELLDTFVADFISARPVEQVAFSSSLSGVWVFGALSRHQNQAQNQARALLPLANCPQRRRRLLLFVRPRQ
jgi:hypothetical protein